MKSFFFCDGGGIEGVPTWLILTDRSRYAKCISALACGITILFGFRL
jgi:hypothetical protein